MNETTLVKVDSENEKTARKIPWLLIILLSYSFLLNLSLFYFAGFSGYIFLIGLINFQFFIIQPAKIKIPFIFKNKSAQFFFKHCSNIIFYSWKFIDKFNHFAHCCNFQFLRIFNIFVDYVRYLLRVLYLY